MKRNHSIFKHFRRNIVVLIACLIPAFIIAVIYIAYRLPDGYRANTADMTGTWKIMDGMNGEWIDPGFNDSAWKEIRLPGAYLNQGFTNRYSTVRKKFVLKEGMKNKDLFFMIGNTRGLMGNVFANGHKIGEIGFNIGGRKTQGGNDQYGFLINREFVFDNGNNLTNTIVIQFEDRTPGFDWLSDPRILAGSSEYLQPYYQKSFMVYTYFQDGINLSGALLLIIMILLTTTEWRSPYRQKYISTMILVLSTVFYNLTFSNSYLKYFVDFPLTYRLLRASVTFICLAVLDFDQYFFFNKINFTSRINRAVCILVIISYFLPWSTAVVEQIFNGFVYYFFILLMYACFLAVAGTMKAKEKRFGIIMTMAIIISSVSGFSDLLTDLHIWNMPMIFNISISIFILISSIVVIAEFINISDTNKILAGELRQLNYSLENKVEERTAELRQANEKLIKMDSIKNDFIANITHNFRSPLTVVLNTIDIILKKNKKKLYREQFETILSSSYRMKNSIDRLLEISRMDSDAVKLTVRKCDPVLFLKAIAEYYQSSVMNVKIKIITRFPADKIEEFYTDEEKLDDVICNILSNAVKYVDPEKGIIEIGLKDDPGYITISIKDNGIGIPGDKLSIIFDRFLQLNGGRNSKYGGTGIGLAFSKQMIEYMKGEIWAESEGENRGSVFFIKLSKGREVFNPLDIAEEPEVGNDGVFHKRRLKYDMPDIAGKDELILDIEKPRDDNDLNYKNGMILIIDDDKPIAELVRNYLSLNGFRNFIIATGGKKGLEAIYEYSPDIILCDYNMPGITGSEIHDEMVENPKYKQVPFIFLSAVADNGLIMERREKGAGAYLKKPIDESDLVLSVTFHMKKYFEYLKMLQLATVDELTGLYNRREIIKRLNEKLAVRKYVDMSLLFFDIDYFKNVNDRYGHPCGDFILRSIGRILTETPRAYDISGRYGGDEFLVILPDTGAADACQVAETLRKKISEEKIEYSGDTFFITGSFGVVSLFHHEMELSGELGLKDIRRIFEVEDSLKTDWEFINEKKKKITDTMLKLADRALYMSKKTACRNCGHNSEKIEEFKGASCPICGSADLSKGRNKVSLYTSDDQ